MKICIVTTEYPPGPMGGVGTYNMEMTKLLVDAGHSVTLITKWHEGAPMVENNSGVVVYRLKPINEISEELVWNDHDLHTNEMIHLRSYTGVFAKKVAELLPVLHAKHGFDVILTQDVEAPMHLLQTRRMLFNEMHDVPIALFVHSPHNQCEFYNDASIYSRWAYHRCLYEAESIALADGLITASEFMKRMVADDMGYPLDRIAVIPCPMGEVPSPYPFEQRVGSDGTNHRLIVYAGRIEIRKGVETLIRAVVPLLKENPCLCVRLYGRDCKHRALGDSVTEHLQKRLIPSELRSRVEFAGPLERNALWAEYGRATIGVVPSRWEPFGLVCQEMMACGTPVVATSAGGMAEMIQDGESGILCAEDNVPALQAALRKAMDAPPATRRQWGDNATRRIRSFCDNGRIVKETIAYLENLKTKQQAAWKQTGRFSVPSNLPFGDVPLSEPHPALRHGTPNPVNKLAVVVPCYNMGTYLDACMKSLLTQERPPDRIYMVDDGSNDPETLTALRLWESHNQVKVLHFENGGLPTARNRGADAALKDGADAIMFLDADDAVEPSYLRKAVEVLNRHPEAGAVTAWTHTVGMMHTYWCPPPSQFPLLLAECMSTPPAVIRASVYVQAGGFSPLLRYTYEDWDFWISICELGYAILMIPEPLIRYLMRRGSMSRGFNAVSREHGRRTIMARHPRMFERFGREALLLVEGFWYSAQGAGEGETELRRELGKCQDFITYLGSLPRRPFEAIRFVGSKVLGRLQKGIVRK